MTVVTWPADVLAATSVQVFPRTLSRSAGVSMAGVEEFVSPATTVWQVEINLPMAKTEDIARRFYGLVAEMQGQLGVARLPLKNHLGYNETFSPRQYPFAPDQYFSGGYGFKGTGVQPVVTPSGAVIGATSLTMVLTDPTRPALSAGQDFSYDDFLYRVTSVSGSTVNFSPAVRTAIPADATLETDPPYIKARFASPDEGARPLLYGIRAEATTLRFIEAFDR